MLLVTDHGVISYAGCVLSFFFFPRDAVLAAVLAMALCPSVCRSQAGIVFCIQTAERIELVFGVEAILVLSYMLYRNSGNSKHNCSALWNFVPNSGL